jgi:hypothetical protein
MDDFKVKKQGVLHELRHSGRKDFAQIQMALL